MPRNSSGAYTLPAGNPVVTGTTITSTWANTLASDIATEITNSLDRQGRGGMLAPFKNSDGTDLAPGITFTNEPTTGILRDSAGVMGFSILTNRVLTVNASGITVVGAITGNLTGNVTGNLTGNVTGAASLNVLKAGDTMTGNLQILNGGDGTLVAGNTLTGQRYGFAQWVDASSLFRIATDGAFPIRFDTSGLERMRIDDSGRVGIGGTPVQKFNVLGGHIRIEDGWSFLWGDSSVKLEGDSSADTFKVYTVAAERMRIDSSGNIGIGVAPTFRLEVSSGASASAARFTSTGASVILRMGDGTAETGYVGSGASLASGLARTDFGAVSVGALVLGSNNTERMRINASGEVSIGTTVASGQLHVRRSTNAQVALFDRSGGADNGSFVGFSQSGAPFGYIGNRTGLVAGGGDSQMVVRGEVNLGFAITNALVGIFDTAYNFGVGTGSPQARIHAYSPSTGNTVLGKFQGALTGGLTINQPAIAGGYADTAQPGDVVVRTESGALRIASETGTITLGSLGAARLFLSAAGNFSVGEVGSDAFKLNVLGSMKIMGSSAYLTFGNNDNGTPCYIQRVTTTDELDIYSGKLTLKGDAGFTAVYEPNGAATPYEIGFRDIPVRGINTFYQLEASDRGKMVTQYAVQAVVVPGNIFPAGAVVSIFNDSGSAIGIQQGTGPQALTLRLAGTSTTGTRTLAAGGIATVWFNTVTNAVISGPGVS